MVQRFWRHACKDFRWSRIQKQRSAVSPWTCQRTEGTFTTREKVFYADERTIHFVRPGRVIKITGAETGSAGFIRVRFKLTDPKELPLATTAPGGFDPSAQALRRQPRQREMKVLSSICVSAIRIGAIRVAFLAMATVLPAVSAEPEKPAGFSGSEACQVCHEDIFKAFQTNKHFAVENDRRRGWEKRACESCHGEGAKHAESAAAADIFQPAKHPAAEQDKTCLKCHLNQTVATGRIVSGHARQQAGCTSCHSVHDAGKQLRKGDARAINAKCGTCHAGVWAQFQKPHHHKLPEGAMSCVDCHNPHGSFPGRAVRTVSANEPGCLRCHGDKRGPFTFEHAPVRIDGCRACHEPHGSANPRMLARAEVRFQCLECHSNITRPGVSTTYAGGIPPAFHDLRNPRFRNCTICHVKIHGSHVNRAFLR